MVSGGWDGQIKVWQTAIVESDDLPNGHRPWSTYFSACGRWMALLSGPENSPSPTLTVFDARSGQRLWSRNVGVCHARAFPYSLICPIAFAATGDEIAFVTADCCVRRCIARSGESRKVHQFECPSRATRLQYSADGGTLAVQTGTIYSADNLKAIPERERKYDCIVFNRDSDAAIRYPEGANGELGSFKTVRGEVWLELTSERKVLLRASPAGPVVLALEGPTEPVQQAAVSPDGCLLAVSGDEQVIYVWNLERAGPPRKFIGHEGIVLDLAFSTDGRTLLSRDNDGTVRFWSVANQAELLKIGTAEEHVVCMGLNPAGSLLVLGIEREGRFSLKVHRLGPNRDMLPNSFDVSQVDKPTLPSDAPADLKFE